MRISTFFAPVGAALIPLAGIYVNAEGNRIGNYRIINQQLSQLEGRTFDLGSGNDATGLAPSASQREMIYRISAFYQQIDKSPCKNKEADEKDKEVDDENQEVDEKDKKFDARCFVPSIFRNELDQNQRENLRVRLNLLACTRFITANPEWKRHPYVRDHFSSLEILKPCGAGVDLNVVEGPQDPMNSGADPKTTESTTIKARSRLFVHFAYEGENHLDSTELKKFQDAFSRDLKGAFGNKIEVLGPDRIDTSLGPNIEIRFLKTDDSGDAEQVAGKIRSILDNFGCGKNDVVVKDLSGRYNDIPSVKARTFELWFPQTFKVSECESL